jgi:hypothetical protein
MIILISYAVKPQLIRSVSIAVAIVAVEIAAFNPTSLFTLPVIDHTGGTRFHLISEFNVAVWCVISAGLHITLRVAMFVLYHRLDSIIILVTVPSKPILKVTLVDIALIVAFCLRCSHF